jgi:hypothetical protein
MTRVAGVDTTSGAFTESRPSRSALWRETLFRMIAETQLLLFGAAELSGAVSGRGRA